ncbi:DUF2075 domain-containing protein [Butyrivibrio sp. X503]|uniref:DUF2075 domain-containing protein n=1 Tax=Butyrivibrio sp. X503 TaxID=2364878 RepID=UPI000EA893D9|nr:DUF2075 domain-containing protein [Butyrivibrio sp. X503]RKM56309.1 DUF2075 domain-containing protein [Butyrivibrio sp. X503]
MERTENLYIITNHPFPKDGYGTETYLMNWPMLYILENGKRIYIGESTNVSERMKQHKANTDKKQFNKVHFIYSDKFNQSVTFDFESKLIQFVSADEKYIITNKNDGIANKDYYRRDDYDGTFECLWNKLRKCGLADHSLDWIKNSEFYKYSPFKELNADQKNQANLIMKDILEGNNIPMVIQGRPGTGKTIVAVYLMKYLRDYEDSVTHKKIFADKKIGLIIPQNSLRATLKKLFKKIDGLASKDVMGASDAVNAGEWDILFVDEAQKLQCRRAIVGYRDFDKKNKRLKLPEDATELDWVLKISKKGVFFFDPEQLGAPSGISAEVFNEKICKEISDRQKIRIVKYAEHLLTLQMRVVGGDEYIKYARALLWQTVIRRQQFDHYEFKIVDSFEKFNRMLYEKEKQYQLSRMIAGYAWPWKTKENPNEYDISIDGIKKKWNSKLKNWVNIENSLNEVGCVHSIAGFDLNYAFVILGDDIKFNPITKQIEVDKNNYFDRRIRQYAKDEELDMYIKNTYYVLMTRGIKGTYLYVMDNNLKKYLQDYVDTI